MATVASKAAIEILQIRFYKTRQDEVDPKDFVIESSVDQKSVEVHASILSVQSPFFHKAVTGSFKESTTKVLRLPKSGEAIEQMVKFMYGLELKIKTILVARELVEMAKMYEVKYLEEAVSAPLTKLLKPSDVLENLIFYKDLEAKEAVEACKELALKTFSPDQILTHEQLEDHPKIAIELWRSTRASPSNRNHSPHQNVVQLFVPGCGSYMTMPYFYEIIASFQVSKELGVWILILELDWTSTGLLLDN